MSQAEFVTRRQRDKAQAEKEYDVLDMCSFSLGRGSYCTGDTRKPGTHSVACPHYKELGRLVD